MPPFRPRAIGEIAIRCDDVGRMARFYETVIGLTRLRGLDSDPIVFLQLGESFGGHTSVIALFDSRLGTPAPHHTPVAGHNSSLHHLALSLPYDEQDAVMRWYAEIGQPFRVEHFDWVGWRGIFTEDPEGNTVELVAFHPDELAKSGA